jgi:hypothetical protein
VSRLSSWSAKAWAAVGVLTVALGVAGAISLRRDDNGESERRTAVADYIAEVNIAHQQSVEALAFVNQTYARVGTPGTRAADLRLAREKVVQLRDRVGAIVPPRDARVLHRELVELLDIEVALAGQATTLGLYVQVLRTQGRRLAAATKRLGRALGDPKGRSPTFLAGAFARYSGAVQQVSNALATVRAPSPLEPARRAEAARVEKLSRLAADLHDAINARQDTETSRLLGELSATAATSTADVQRRATIAYNRGLRRVQRQASVVERERQRLDRMVP